MKTREIFTLVVAFVVLTVIQMNGQSIVGTWKNIDDTDGVAKSHITIYEQDGQWFGKVVKLLPAADITHCKKCKGERKNKSLIGMDILWNLKKKAKAYGDGKIVDPASGKVYTAKVWVNPEDHTELKVRGYHWTGIYRTQSWFLVE